MLGVASGAGQARGVTGFCIRDGAPGNKLPALAPALLSAAPARRRRGCVFDARNRVEEDDAPVALLLAFARAAGADVLRRNMRSGTTVLVLALGAPGTQLTATRLRLLRRRGGRRDGRQTMPARGGLSSVTLFAGSTRPRRAPASRGQRPITRPTRFSSPAARRT
jgi:hypothetical protein